MTIGDLVREAEQDEEWQMFPEQVGVIISSADEKNEMPGSGRFWNVLFETEITDFLDTDLEKVS